MFSCGQKKQISWDGCVGFTGVEDAERVQKTVTRSIEDHRKNDLSVSIFLSSSLLSAPDESMSPIINSDTIEKSSFVIITSFTALFNADLMLFLNLLLSLLNCFSLLVVSVLLLTQFDIFIRASFVFCCFVG